MPYRRSESRPGAPGAITTYKANIALKCWHLLIDDKHLLSRGSGPNAYA